jgi:hypothetical protein
MFGGIEMRKKLMLLPFVLFLLASCGRDVVEYSEAAYSPMFAGTAEVAEIPAQEETPSEEPPAFCEEPESVKTALFPLAELATALTAFFTDAVSPPDSAHARGYVYFMPYSSHAIWVDLDGNGTQGVLASAWKWEEGRRPDYFFEQYLFWFCGDELRKETLEFTPPKFGITPTGRLVVMDDVSFHNLTADTSYTILDFVTGELRFTKTVNIAEYFTYTWELGEISGYEYLGSEYAMRTYANGNPWQWQERICETSPITQEEFYDIMTQYGLFGATTFVWELPDETQAILSMYGFAEILNAYAEFLHPDFSVRDEFLEHRYFVERDYRFRREHHSLAPAIKYAFRDINGDGEPELFIGIGTVYEREHEPLIYVIYTKQNGVPVPVIIRDNHNSLHLSTDIYGNFIINRAWARMGGTGNAAYVLNESGDLIRLDYIMSSQIWEENDSEHGDWVFMCDRYYRYADDELIHITEEEYNEFFIRYGIRNGEEQIELQWTHILQ